MTLKNTLFLLTLIIFQTNCHTQSRQPQKKYIGETEKNLVFEQDCFKGRNLEVFKVVQNPPQPKLGKKEFLRSLNEEVDFPESRKQYTINAQLFIQADGVVCVQHILTNLDSFSDAMNLAATLEKGAWQPGRQVGREVHFSKQIRMYIKGGQVTKMDL